MIKLLALSLNCQQWEYRCVSGGIHRCRMERGEGAGAASVVEEQGGLQWNASSVSGLSFLLIEWY